MLVMTTKEEEAARRVAEAIRTRRTELGLSQQEIVARVRDSGESLSLNNFRAYEWGSRPNPSVAVLAAISRALDFESDALSKIFNGSDEAPAAGDRSIAARLARIEAQLGADDPTSKLTDYDAVRVILRCLNDEQYRVVALAVNADDRFRAAIT